MRCAGTSKHCVRAASAVGLCKDICRRCGIDSLNALYIYSAHSPPRCGSAGGTKKSAVSCTFPAHNQHVTLPLKPHKCCHQQLSVCCTPQQVVCRVPHNHTAGEATKALYKRTAWVCKHYMFYMGCNQQQPCKSHCNNAPSTAATRTAQPEASQPLKTSLLVLQSITTTTPTVGLEQLRATARPFAQAHMHTKNPFMLHMQRSHVLLRCSCCRAAGVVRTCAANTNPKPAHHTRALMRMHRLRACV